jgi:hypothetical protein
MANEQSGTETCPSCGGVPEHMAVLCGPKSPGDEELGCRMTTVACDFCGGLGIVEVEAANRYRRGLAFRNRRVKKWQLTQSQLAHILKISPIALNDFEHGRADLPAGVDRRLLDEYESRD